MLRMAKYIVIALISIASTPWAWAWSAPAHRVIAQIAYDQLKPEVRREVQALTAMINQDYHQGGRFESASLWADQIIMRDVTAFNHWHYIDIPYSPDHSPLPSIAKENVVWALQQSYKVLSSSKSAKFEKALFLRFFVHFVGDIHQPLHCTTRVSRQFPQGDRGGNLYKIKASGSDNLHAYWDKSLGLFAAYYEAKNSEHKRKLVNQWAQAIQTHYPRSQYSHQLLSFNPELWANESFQIATTFVYTLAENAQPSEKYINQGQRMIEERLALAGYRLAEVLNKSFIFSNANNKEGNNARI